MWALFNLVYFLSALEPNALTAYVCCVAALLIHHDLVSCHTHLAFYIVLLLPFRVYQDVSLLVKVQGPLERMGLGGTNKKSQMQILYFFKFLFYCCITTSFVPLFKIKTYFLLEMP